MDITTDKKPARGVLAGKAGILAMVLGGLTGIGALGALLDKAFTPARTAPQAQSPGEARIASRAEEARSRAEAGVPRMRQEEVGSGYQFDALGNYLAPRVDPKDLPENQPLVSLEPGQGSPAGPIAAGIQEPPPSSWRKDRSEDRDTDAGLFKERREARKEDRADLQASMLGYTTSGSARWATRRAEPGAQRAGAAAGEATSLSPEDAQIRANNQSMERLAAVAEKAMTAAPEGAPGPAVPRQPAESASQMAPPGEVADMRISGGTGPDVVVREGKFLDCLLINRVESDIADSPVMAQVARDFLTLDGKDVLIPAGARLYGTAGRVESLQQAKLFIKFHKIVFPRRRPEETPKVAFFPSRQFPAMDSLGRLGVGGQVNRHMLLQFGAAIMLGVFDGMAAQVQSPGADDNPTARDMVLSRTSQNFANVVNAVIQRYANVVPTVTLKEGTKLKCYFTQDVALTPFMATRDLSWVRGQ
jgi:type IV secretory pathway VirB10-like protein